MPVLDVMVRKLGGLAALDDVGGALEKVVRPVTQPTPVKNALSGTWLGHRLHPMLTDVAIGALSGASVLDLLRPGDPKAARRLMGVGILAVLPTAASGLSDWVDVYEGARRVGLVHAMGNTVALGLYGASFAARGRGGGRLLGLMGLGVLAFSGYLGAHLAYVMGVGVDHTGFNPALEDWVDVAASAEVGDQPLAAMAGEVEVLLVRQGGELHALANRCSHAGWGLDKGTCADGSITCPGHGSCFSLADGAVRRGPAASPQPVYKVREREGRVEVRS